MQYLDPASGGLVRRPGKPQHAGKVWHGKPQPRRIRRYHHHDDLAGNDDVNPDDIATLTIRSRGRLVASRVPMNLDAAKMLREQVASHGRKVVVTAHLKDGGVIRYRGNGRRKGERRGRIPIVGPRPPAPAVVPATAARPQWDEGDAALWTPRRKGAEPIPVVIIGWNGPQTRLRFRATPGGRILSAKPDRVRA